MTQTEKVANKVVYFQRTNPKGVTEKTVEQDLILGELGDQALDSYRALLTELFLPLLKEQGNWGKSSGENTQEFLQVRVCCHKQASVRADLGAMQSRRTPDSGLVMKLIL